MKKLVFLFMLSLLMISMAWGQTPVFSDNFSNYQSASWTTSGQIGSSSFYVSRSGNDWGARRNTSPAQLELTNDVGANTNIAGWVFANVATSGFTSPYNTTLSSNTGLVTWSFNIRQIRSDPAGYAAGSYGAAFILATTSQSVNNTGTGYAIVYGQSGGTDPIRLAKYSGGLLTGLTNIITSNTTGLTDFGAEYISVKVTYNPSNDQWELFLRNDGSSAFADPLSGTLVSQGTATDNTYTSISLAYIGAYWQGSTSGAQTAFFDNVVVSVTSGGVSAPTVQAKDLTFTNVQQNQMDVSWTNGDGAKRVVIMNTTNTFTTPVDGTDPTANNVYGGSGQQVVYNNSGNSVTVTGLNASTAYWFRVYEYNGSGTGTKYLSSAATNNPNSQTTSAPAPVITLSTASLTGFTYVLGSGPSTEQTFTVSGTNLTQNISISAPTNYEISKTSDTGYSTPLTFAHSGGTVSAQTVYVRLKSGLSIGSYNGEDITATSSGATNKTVTCSGSVSTPPSPTAPSATAASYTDYDSFTANWDSVSGATGYYLDVYTYGSGTFATDLLISEYVEGSGSNKYIEIYNGTGSTVDLSNYRLKLYFNGSGTATGLTDVALTGTLAHGACIVYKNSSASLTLPEGVTAINTSAVNFNGDDAVALVKVVNEVEEFVDIFGMIGQDPGTQWTADGGYTTLNKTLVRKSSVTEGVSVNPSGYSADDTSAFETLGTEWDVYDQDTSSYLGSHTMAGAASAEYVTGYQNRNVGNVTSYEVTGLDADTQYFYVVRAFHTYGTSGNSNEISVTTDTYDYPNGDDVIVGDNTVTVTNGNANNGTGTLPAWPNGDVTEGTYDSLILDLLGAGPWTVTILSDAYYCAYSQGAGWNLATPVSGGFEIEVDAPVKGEPLYILLSNEDPTLPVELSSFTVAMNAYNAAVLTWVTQTETGVNGFYIYRGTTDQLSEAALVSSLIPATNTSQTQVYRYSDSELFSEGTYYYWLNVNDMDGSESFHGPVTLVYETGENPTPNIPQVTELKSIYPNPFNPSANISFGLAKSSDVEFKIYNSRGQMVRNMALGVKDAGTWNLVWNGTDNNGRAVPTGIYYIQMQAGKDSFIRKAVMMK